MTEPPQPRRDQVGRAIWRAGKYAAVIGLIAAALAVAALIAALAVMR